MDISIYNGLEVHKLSSENSTDTLFLIIPGNPGLPGVYRQLTLKLKDDLLSRGKEADVWSVSHCCHSFNSCTMSDYGSHRWWRPFGLYEQLALHRKFILEVIMLQHSYSCVHLVGHSVGCWFIIQLLDMLRHDPCYSRLSKAMLLFPTIEYIAVSPKGIVLTPLLSYLRWCGPLASRCLSIFPFLVKPFWHWYVKTKYAKLQNNDDVNAHVFDALTHPLAVRNWLHMGHEEMGMIRELDTRAVKNVLSKLSFYYGIDDHWCPSFYKDGLLERFPDADVLVDDTNAPHDFVFTHSNEIAIKILDHLGY